MSDAYPSLAAFYAADPGRQRSPERDVGLRWHAADTGATYRAAWVRDTGELYLARHGVDEPGAPRVEIVAHIPDGVELARRLEGWSGAQAHPGSVSWLRDRARRPSHVGASHARRARPQARRRGRR